MKSNLASSHKSAVYIALAIWSTRARVADTSIPCLLPHRRTGPEMASSSGVRPAATSFCIELRRAAGAPSGAARTDWGVSFASSAIATEQASVTHDFRREYQLASDRTAPSVPPRPLLPGQTAPESTACPKASSPGRPEPRSSTPQHAAHRTVAPPALASWGWGRLPRSQKERAGKLAPARAARLLPGWSPARPARARSGRATVRRGRRR